MCKVRILRTLVKQRLDVAVDEIFQLFERTIAEYEEELCRSKEENERHRELLHAVLKPSVRLHTADVQQMLQENVPSEEPEERPHIKAEKGDVWRCLGEEQLHGQEEEADVYKPILTIVDVKMEEDKAQSSQSQHGQSEGKSSPHMTTEANEDVYSESDSLFTPLSDMDNMMSHSSDTDHSHCGKTFLKTKKKSKVDTTSHTEHDNHRNPFKCSECGKRFAINARLKAHMLTHTGEKPFSCLVCGKRFAIKQNMKRHMVIHTGVKPHSCSICPKRFYERFELNRHMRRHSTEKAKPFTCSLCAKRFCNSSTLKVHMKRHTA
ncbi:uncharacterized protein LOC144062725 [Vanacampus margaritifer]